MAGALLALPGRAAWADPPGAPPVTTVGYRDWRADCAPLPCRISTVVAGAGGAPVVTLAVEGPAEALALTVATPLAVFVPDGVLLGVGEEADRPLVWRVCGPAGCEARVALDPELLAGLRRAPEGRVTLTLADGVTVRLGVSLRGFSGAMRVRERGP